MNTQQAPQITPEDIEDRIVAEHYFSAADGVLGAHGTPIEEERLHMLTICVLQLDNGFLVTGESACVSSGNFDPEMGREIARKKAFDKLWPLMGFALTESLKKE